MLSLFVDHGGDKWTSGEKLARLEACRAAEDWMDAEARRYGVTLSLHDGGNFGMRTSLKDALKALHGRIASESGARAVHAESSSEAESAVIVHETCVAGRRMEDRGGGCRVSGT